MVEGTHCAQLAKAVSALMGEYVQLREEQERQRQMLELVLQQINNLVASYDPLAVTTGNQQSREGS